MTPEEIVEIHVGSKIDALGIKIKAIINNDFNPKVSLYSLHRPSPNITSSPSYSDLRIRVE